MGLFNRFVNFWGGYFVFKSIFNLLSEKSSPKEESLEEPLGKPCFFNDLDMERLSRYDELSEQIDELDEQLDLCDEDPEEYD